MITKARSFFFSIWLLFCLLFAHAMHADSDDRNSKAFYAISSLKFFIDETLANLSNNTSKDVNKIHFDERDIAYLWLLASSNPSIDSQIQEAQENYYHAFNSVNQSLSYKLYKKSGDILDAVWQELNPYWIHENSLIDLVTRSHHHPYPNFDNNPYITHKMRSKMRPYLLSTRSKLKPALDAIFNSARVIQNENSFAEAGFAIVAHQYKKSLIWVARHATVPGYLFKVYLDSDPLIIEDISSWERLTRRCMGAANIRRLIKHKKLIHFTVPDKWLYPPSISHLSSKKHHQTIQPILLLVTDMNIVSTKESAQVWKNDITHEHLDELYCILSHGFSSTVLPLNVPYCKNGKFACIDTEHPKRKIKYSDVKEFLSPKMQIYWDKLVQNGGYP